MTPSLSGLPPIRTALIGYGFAGKTFHAPLIRAVPALCLEHVVSRDPGRVHADLPEARVSADPDEAIEAADIDLVVIASPNATTPASPNGPCAPQARGGGQAVHRHPGRSPAPRRPRP